MELFQTIDILIFLAYALVFLCIVTKLTSTILGVFFFFRCNHKLGKRLIIFSLAASDSITSTRRGSFFIGGFSQTQRKKTDNRLDVLVYTYTF